ncbi:Hypothetical predicted protein [Paramuricea clavata]|uniref:Uncharacterized protein n=1 Tax=Paramuricea clavata TaxID=317549 RepID=A0A6S7IDP9_PARCT|nr:Hypothetical predicted protein [Paramuricea clavata]
MSNQEKQGKSKGVLLRRSKQQPDGKAIQGLVFDHPSMPKIVTISSAPRTKSSSGNNPTVHRARREHNPTGGKSLTGENPPTGEKSPAGGKHPTAHRPHEQYETGHFTRQHAARHSAAQPATTVHYTPAQYPTVYRTSAQNLSSSSPPALIRTPSQYSTQTPASVRQFHAANAERVLDGSRAEIATQSGKSQIRFPSYYRSGPLPSTLSAAQNTQFQYAQHEPNSPRTQETTLRRNSTGALRHHLQKRAQLRENIVQHSHNIPNIVQHSHNNPNIAQHSHNNPQDSIELGTDEFSRDFHLHVWRESHERAINEWNPPMPPIRRLDQPTRGLDPPVRRLDHPVHLPLTSGHNVDGTMPRYRSLSTSAGFPGERGDHLSHQRPNPQPRASPVPSNLPPGQYGNTRSPREMRRYSTGHVELAYSEVCTTEPQNSPEEWTYEDHSPRVRSAEGTNARVPSAGSIRRSSNITDEYIPVVPNAEGRNSHIVNSGHLRSSSSNSIEDYNPVVRNAEGRNSQIVNSGHLRSSSSNSIEDYNLVVRNAEGRNSQIVNSGHLRSSSSNSIEDYNPVVRNAEGRNLEVLNAGNIRTPSNTSEDYNPVVRNAEGRNLEVSSADNIRKSSVSNESEAQANVQRRRRRRTRQQNPPTVVVISDSDDEEMRILTPLSNDEFDQDVFTVEPNNQAGQPYPVVRESLGSPHSSESEEACIITKVKAPGKKSSRELQKLNGSSETGQESRAYDVNNNESREGVGTSGEQCREGMGMSSEQSREGVEASYRSVLYEREITGQTGTQRVIMSEQLFVNNRGTKRPLEDKRQYFVAGSAEIAGSSLDCAARKIRRVSCNELDSRNAHTRSSTDLTVDFKTCRQSSQNKHGPGLKLTRSHDDMPTLVRSRSENDEQISKPKWKSERSTSLTYDISTFSKQEENTENCIIKPGVELIESRKLSAKTASEMKPHCNVCFDRRVIRVSELLPEASGLVSRDEIQCRNCDRVLNECDSPGNDIAHTVVNFPKSGPKPTGIVVGIKQAPEVEPLESKTAALEKELKQLLECKKPAKNSGITYVIHEDDDVMYKDKTLSKVSDDLDVLHFSVVKRDSDVTWTNSKDHVKNTTSSRDQVHSSQQWEAYSLKLEQEQMAKHSCGRKESNVFNIKRNSWEELKEKFASVGKRDRVSCSDATRKRAHSGENVLDTLCRKSYRFHDATKKLHDEYKQRKLSEESVTVNSSDKVSELLDSRDTCENDGTQNTDIQNEAITPSSYSCTNVAKIQEFSPAEDKLYEIRLSEEKPFEVNTREKHPYDIRPSDINPSLIEPTSPGKEPQAARSPQKEELSLQEWTEILQGRISQVRESIEEERTPWKTKNKKKVLEKLENHFTWITGPDVDEAIFVSRKLQFFQTMRKQYELMNKIKAQRHTMKFSDGPAPVLENVEKPKAKSAKEVVVCKKTKDVKKTAKCKPKSVKNSQGGMMKKIRKAVLS